MRVVKTPQISCILVKEIFTRWARKLLEVWQESTGFTPAEVMLGHKLKGPLERAILRPPDPNSPAYPILEKSKELIQTVQRNVEQEQRKQRKHYNLSR